jgi:hypothetical protein
VSAAPPVARRTTDRLFDALACLGFLVLFPLFVVYHYALANGWISPVFGGLFSFAAVIFAAFAVLQLAGQYVNAAATSPLIERLFICFCVYLFVWMSGAGLFILNRSYVGPALTEGVLTLAIWLATYFASSRLRLGSSSVRRSLWLSALLVGGLLLHAMISRQSFLGPFLTFDRSDPNAVFSTYQSIGRSIMVIAIVIAASQSRLSRQLLVLTLALVALIALGSRSHLFATLAIVLSLAALFLVRRKQRAAALAFVIVLSAVSYAAIDFVVETRAGEILALAQSASWQERREAQHRAIQVIEEKPLVGDFGYHFRGNETSGYAHNVLSVWSQLGGITFVLYLALLLYPLWLSARRALLREYCTPLWHIAFQMNLTSLLLAVASEPILMSVFPALGWGFTANALRHERRQTRARDEAVYVGTSVAEQQART